MNRSSSTADVFRALGHPARLRIVAALRKDGEACVCHLEHDLGLRQAYLSQHLAKLRAAGVVTDRRVGSNVFYALAGDWVPKLMETVGAAGSPPSPSHRAGSRARARRACPCPRCSEKHAHPRDPLATRASRGVRG
jgi:ArsR family transcriptional regulator